MQHTFLKTILILFLFIVGAPLTSKAQDDKVYSESEVEEKPEFPGGMVKYYEYIQEEMNYPVEARNMGLQGKVKVGFVIDKNGQVTDVKVIQGIGGACDEEAMRLFKQSPKWTPGKKQGKPVKVAMTFNVNFKLG
ncbi:MAG: energy transducer TonB [Cytophagales bacterium]|nr:MAG: energy transducer TonB [Cytophagales bacterium]